MIIFMLFYYLKNALLRDSNHETLNNAEAFYKISM